MSASEKTLETGTDGSSADVVNTLTWLKPEIQVTLLELFAGSTPCREEATRPLTIRAFRLGQRLSV